MENTTQISPDLRHEILNHLAVVQGQLNFLSKAAQTNTFNTTPADLEKNMLRIEKALYRLQNVIEELVKTRGPS